MCTTALVRRLLAAKPSIFLNKTPRRDQSHVVGERWAALAATLTLAICFAPPGAAQAADIQVNTKQQGVSNGQCSLQEAIYSSEFKLNIAVDSTDPDHFYTTGCAVGTGNDTIWLVPTGAVFDFERSWDGDAHNIYGPTATPVIFSTITIEGNGATLEWANTFSPIGNSRLFAVGTVNVPAGTNSPGFIGTGNLTLENVSVKGFHIKGGDGGLGGGGGGLGAGGAIFVDVGAELTVENSTFENNGAVGGNGGGGPLGYQGGLGEAGGGGGLSGNGGNGFGGGGGGGGSHGNGGDGGEGPNPGGAGGGGGGTIFSGASPVTAVGSSGGYLCGGNGGDLLGGHNGHDAGCAGGGGGGSGTDFSNHGNGGSGDYGGGGGGGSGNGGNGNFGGGGGGGLDADIYLSGGDGGFGGGGGAAASGGAWWTHPGKGGRFGGRADGGFGGGGGALGGAIFSYGGQVHVHNSTFFNNSVTRGAKGGGTADNGADAGGAIFVFDNELEVTDSTFSGNQATGSGAAIVINTDFGNSGFSTYFTVNDSIIANNGANECFYNGTLIARGSGNLITNNGTGGQFSPCLGVVTTSDPQLQTLRLNSPGNTPTMAIARSSPAFNTADPATSLQFDQRHAPRPRPKVGGFDIGAFEWQEGDR